MVVTYPESLNNKASFLNCETPHKYKCCCFSSVLRLKKTNAFITQGNWGSYFLGNFQGSAIPLCLRWPSRLLSWDGLSSFQIRSRWRRTVEFQFPKHLGKRGFCLLPSEKLRLFCESFENRGKNFSFVNLSQDLETRKRVKRPSVSYGDWGLRLLEYSQVTRNRVCSLIQLIWTAKRFLYLLLL